MELPSLPPKSPKPEKQFPLSKRELIATMALQGLLSHSTAGTTYSDYAKIAIKYADALISQLEFSETKNNKDKE